MYCLIRTGPFFILKQLFGHNGSPVSRMHSVSGDLIRACRSINRSTGKCISFLRNAIGPTKKAFALKIGGRISSDNPGYIKRKLRLACLGPGFTWLTFDLAVIILLRYHSSLSQAGRLCFLLWSRFRRFASRTARSFSVSEATFARLALWTLSSE